MFALFVLVQLVTLGDKSCALLPPSYKKLLNLVPSGKRFPSQRWMSSKESLNDDGALETTTSSHRKVEFSVSFSHVHLFVDHVDSFTSYKQFEDSLNRFHAATSSNDTTLVQKQRLWESMGYRRERFFPQNRDIVKQLMAGFGFRVTGYRFPSADNGASARTLLISSRDLNGVQFVVTAAADPTATDQTHDEFSHFDAGKLLDGHGMDLF